MWMIQKVRNVPQGRAVTASSLGVLINRIGNQALDICVKQRKSEIADSAGPFEASRIKFAFSVFDRVHSILFQSQ
jgi:hypothetical protein